MAYNGPNPLVPHAGGTGVANADTKLITLGGSLTTSGSFDSTFTMTGTTGVTFPTSGTLATTSQLPSISVTQHAVVVGGAANALTSTSVGATGTVLAGNTGADPTFQTVASIGGITTITGNSGGAESPSSGNFNVVGTGSITVAGSANTETVQLTGLTNHNVLVGAGTATITNVAPSATSGVALISQGASADPIYGTVVVAGGGTGAVTLTGILTGNGTSAVTANTVTQHGVLIGGASNAASSLGVASTGTVLAGSTGADPAFTATPTVTSISFGGSALGNYVASTTFTPIVSFGGGSTGVTYGNQLGRYARIGNVVYFNIDVSLTNKGSSSGNAQIGGLPLTSANDGVGGTGINIAINNITAASSTYFYGALLAATTNILLFSAIAPSGTNSIMTDANFANNTSLQLQGFYFV